MSGSIFLYLSNEGKVYKIPKPKYSTYKSVPSLANEEVLMTILGYETLNRKPHELNFVSFQRVKLDNNGYRLNFDENKDNGLINFLNYAFSTAESLSLMDEPIPLPLAPDNIPTSIQKEALYSYVKEMYPDLLPNCSHLIEQNIKAIEDNYTELKNLVKEAYRLNNKK